MEKIVLAAASYENKKYYLSPDFQQLPETIQQEIRQVCILVAQRLHCSFIIGFHENGEIYFDLVKPENSIDFDDIGAQLEMKSLQKEKKELIKSLKLWYLIFKTKQGEKIKQKLLNNDQTNQE